MLKESLSPIVCHALGIQRRRCSREALACDFFRRRSCRMGQVHEHAMKLYRMQLRRQDF